MWVAREVSEHNTFEVLSIMNGALSWESSGDRGSSLNFSSASVERDYRNTSSQESALSAKKQRINILGSLSQQLILYVAPAPIDVIKYSRTLMPVDFMQSLSFELHTLFMG